MLTDLNDLGYDVDNLDDLRHCRKSWETAIPVLVRWLARIEDPNVKEGIVRCLSVPWAANTTTQALIQEFRRYATLLAEMPDPWVGKSLGELSEEEKRSGRFFSLAWAIGNALSTVDVKGFESQIIELCRDVKYGSARQMLVLGLGGLRRSDAEQAAIGLLNDEQVNLHAISALGKMKSKHALFALESLLSDKRAAIRNEARKAIAKITRSS